MNHALFQNYYPHDFFIIIGDSYPKIGMSFNLFLYIEVYFLINHVSFCYTVSFMICTNEKVKKAAAAGKHRVQSDNFDSIYYKELVKIHIIAYLTVRLDPSLIDCV